MTGQSLFVVVDEAAEIRDRGDGVLGPKYKLWNGFGF